MENENNNDYKFLIEKPSKEDLFDSGSHSRTATAVFKSLKNDNDINVVGVEGNLGSGKSTVLELIKCLSEEEQYEFVEFDVERFQHGATKKALIEKLYSAIENSVASTESKAKIEKAKNVALGNHFEYTSNIKSNVNIWIVWFTIALLAAVRLLPDALSGLGNFILYLYHGFVDGFGVANHSFNVSGLSILSIILAWFPYHIVRCAQKSRKILWFFGKPPSTGDIFKRNSKDTISETIEINKEVGAYELQEALESFVDEIPEEKRFILVLDNLDRVTEEKLREVWSDIEVFTSIAQTKIQLLIPYSIKHVASSLSSDEAEGIEFISKRIPISFRVAPILSADWKRSCSEMIVETGISIENEELKGILLLIDLWTYAFNTQVTPRLMKKLTNSIVSILSTHNEPIHVITAFYYQLSVQSNRVSSTEVLSSESQDNSIQERLLESKKIIERTINFELWSKELVSIHYLSSYNVAESEILTSPLTRALESGDIEPFIAKQNIYAYDKILLDLIDREGTDKFISLMLLMKKSEDEKYFIWVDKWSEAISTAIDKDSFDIEDIKTLVSSTQQLSDLGIDVNMSRIASYYKSIDKAPSKLLELDNINETLETLYGCSQLLRKTPSVIKSFDANMFIEHLWPKRKVFQNWKIGGERLKENDIKNLFSVANKADIHKDLLEYISSCFKLGWLNEDESLIKLYSSMPSAESINDEESILESNIYNEEWYEVNLHSYYQQGLETIDKQNKPKWLAQAISNMVYHNTYQYIAYYEDYIELNDQFHNELANCFAVSCGFDQLLSSLENEELSKYVAKAINILVANKRVNRLNITQAIKNYEALKVTNTDSSTILNLLWGWQAHYKFTLKALENMNESFLKDVINIDNSDLWRDKILKLIDSGGDADIDWWIRQIKKPSPTIKLLVDEWYLKNDKSLIKCGSLSDALKQFFNELPSNNVHYSSKAWIGRLISLLPKTSRTALSRLLNKLIGLENTSIQSAQFIVENCNNYVELQDTMKSELILTLFENIVSSQKIATWFDVQNIDFEKWDDSSASSFVTQMIHLEENGFLFENLNTVPVIQDAKSLLTKTTGD